MRIPSQFDQDSLYHRNPRRGSAAVGTRQLIRLVVVLALVVVVMRQAGREEIYAPFLPATTQEFSQSDSFDPSSLAGGGEKTPVPNDRPSVTPINPIEEALASERMEALGRVADGSPWRPEDADALASFLESCRVGIPLRSNEDAPLVGVLPLLQQPELYQGKLISTAGQVARVEKISDPRAMESYGEYWQLWLRPFDGSRRPILLIVPSVPDELAQWSSTETIRDGPSVTARGYFLKRLAYRSSAGADLAPVIVGRLQTPARPVPSAAPPPGEAAWWKSWWVALAVVSASVGFAGLLTWRSARDAARMRRIRAAGRDRKLDWMKDAP